MNKPDLRFRGEREAWQRKYKYGRTLYEVACLYVMDQTDESGEVDAELEELNAQLAPVIVRSVFPPDMLKLKDVEDDVFVESSMEEVGNAYKGVISARIAVAAFGTCAALTSIICNEESVNCGAVVSHLYQPDLYNGRKVAEKAQGEAVKPQYDRLNDARWALRAWKRRRSDDQLKPHDGKHVAIYRERVWASDDDRDTAIQKALVEIQESEQVAVTEDDLCVDFWGPSGSFSVHPWYDRQADAAWALREWSRRQSVSEYRPYLGKYVAVLGQEVVAYGDDRREVRERAAQERQVPAERIFVDFWEEVEPETDSPDFFEE